MIDVVINVVLCVVIITIAILFVTAMRFRDKVKDLEKILEEQNKSLCRTCANCLRHDGTRIYCSIDFHDKEQDEFVVNNIFLEDAVQCKYYIERSEE